MPKTRMRPSDVAPQPAFVTHITAADIAISTTPAEVHSLALGSAGTWLVEINDGVEWAALVTTRDLTWLINVTNFTSMSLLASTVRNAASATVLAAITASGGGFAMGSIPTGSVSRGRMLASGVVTVSAAAVISITGTISGEAASVKPGSLARARKYA